MLGNLGQFYEFFMNGFKFLYGWMFPPAIALAGRRIIISKVNQIGDVTFSLPLASALKRADPTCTVIFLGRGYTEAVCRLYADIDEFADWDKLRPVGLAGLKADVILHIADNKEIYRAAVKAAIPVRIGCLRKARTWFTCNRWVNVKRSNTELHETQLDMRFLKPFHLKTDYTLPEIIALRRFTFTPTLTLTTKQSGDGGKPLLDPRRFNLILHPKTRGQHQEWPEEHYVDLIRMLPPTKFNILVTGSAEEHFTYARLPRHVHDLTGRTTVEELVDLVRHADGLIGASTGPVHLAANFNLWTLGLYTLKKPQYAVRWGPVGTKAVVLNAPVLCDYCSRNISSHCFCLDRISPEEVYRVLQTWTKNKE